MTEREALKLALEALKDAARHLHPAPKQNEAITAIKEALAQPEQEPVAIYQYQMGNGSWIDQDQGSYRYNKQHGNTVRIVYTTPPQRKPLTDEQVNECGMCGYVGKNKGNTGQCPKCRWDELRPLIGKLPQKPLTDEQIYEMYNEPRSDSEMLEFARAIEAAHGIKGD